MVKSKEWFEEWFDTSYYHVLYANRDYTEAQFFINNLITFLDLPKQAKVLDFACGKGRHSLQLNELGFDVLGVDLSPNSIAEASKFSKEGLRFDVADIREVISGEQFDGIFNLFTSFGYFNSLDENIKVLKSIETMLKDNGLFVIDFMNAHQVVNTLVPEAKISRGGIDFDISKRVENGQIIKDINFEDKGETFHFQEKVQAIFLKDFEEMIERTNLQIDHVFGDYALNEFNQNESSRLILVGSKK